MEKPGEWQSYKVKKVLLSWEQHYRRGKAMTEYLIHWKRYRLQYNEWYSEDLLNDCLKIIIAYEKLQGNTDIILKLKSCLTKSVVKVSTSSSQKGTAAAEKALTITADDKESTSLLSTSAEPESVTHDRQQMTEAVSKQSHNHDNDDDTTKSIIQTTNLCSSRQMIKLKNSLSLSQISPSLDSLNTEDSVSETVKGQFN